MEFLRDNYVKITATNKTELDEKNVEITNKIEEVSSKIGEIREL